MVERAECPRRNAQGCGSGRRLGRALGPDPGEKMGDEMGEHRGAEALTLEDKHALMSRLVAAVEAQLASMVQAHQATQRGLTHAEARPENDKDTRAIEGSYLARGLAERVARLEGGLATLRALRPRRFEDEEPAALGAVVAVQDEDSGERTRYLLVPAGAGQQLSFLGSVYQAVTTASPLGAALLGKYADEDVELRTPQGVRTLVVTAIR